MSGETGDARTAWQVREDAAAATAQANWWPPGDQQQQQQADERAQQSQQHAALAAAAHHQQHQQQQQQQQLYPAYKMAGAVGFGASPPPGFEYRVQPQWWYATPGAPPPQDLHQQHLQQQRMAAAAAAAHRDDDNMNQQNQNQQNQHSTQNSQQSVAQQQSQQNQQQALQQNQLQQQAQQTLQQQIQNAQQQLQSAQQQLQSQQQQLQNTQLTHLQSQQLQTQQLQSHLQLQHQGLQHLAQSLQGTQGSDTKSRMSRGKPDNIKPRGRITAYAYFVQTCREEHKKKHPDENVIFADFSKKCAERWKTMVDKEKQRFHEMAERDKKRYDMEMQTYVPPKGEKLGRGRKRKQIKDPNAPKRSLSAFFWFCNDERSKVKALNPEFGVGNIAKELGRRWADCDPETKAKYEAMSERDKARYDREMTAYKNKPKNNVPIQEYNDGQMVEGDDDDCE